VQYVSPGGGRGAAPEASPIFLNFQEVKNMRYYSKLLASDADYFMHTIFLSNFLKVLYTEKCLAIAATYLR
jgi:hypothetical protein